MGKKRIAVIGEPAPAKPKSQDHRPVAHSGKGQTGRLTDMGALALEELEKQQAAAPSAVPAAPSPVEGAKEGAPKKSVPHKIRSARYLQARAKIDKAKTYSLTEAVKLAKAVSLSRFDGNLEAHCNLTESGLHLKVSFPHPTGSQKQRVAIADDKLLPDIAAGKLNFDILLATKEFMPKLLPYAKILGPKGLLPNPKTGTLVADPIKAKQALQSGTVPIKSEAKTPLLHAVIGKLSQPDEQLVANLTALIQAITPQRLTKLSLAPTMGPSLKVNFVQLS